MQCPFSIRHEVLPDVNSQLRGFDDDIDVLNIPFTLTQGDLLQEALAVTFAKDQTPAKNKNCLLFAKHMTSLDVLLDL
jgi:hypothetical protein